MYYELVTKMVLKVCVVTDIRSIVMLSNERMPDCRKKEMRKFVYMLYASPRNVVRVYSYLEQGGLIFIVFKLIT